MNKYYRKQAKCSLKQNWSDKGFKNSDEKKKTQSCKKQNKFAIRKMCYFMYYIIIIINC